MIGNAWTETFEVVRSAIDSEDKKLPIPFQQRTCPLKKLVS
jgi:hypothetical protein